MQGSPLLTASSTSSTPASGSGSPSSSVEWPTLTSTPLSAAAPLLFPMSATLRNRLSSLPRLDTSTSTSTRSGASRRLRRHARSYAVSDAEAYFAPPPLPARPTAPYPPIPTLHEAQATETFITPPLLQLNNVAFTLPRTPFTAASLGRSASPHGALGSAASDGQEGGTTSRLPLAGTKEGYRASLGVPILQASLALQRCTMDSEADSAAHAAVAQPASFLDLHPSSTSLDEAYVLQASPSLAPCKSVVSPTSVAHAQATLGKARPLSLTSTQPHRQAPRHPARKWSLSVSAVPQYAHAHAQGALRSADVTSQREEWSFGFATATEEEERYAASPIWTKRSCEPEVVGAEWSEEHWPSFSNRVSPNLPATARSHLEDEATAAAAAASPTSPSTHFIYSNANANANEGVSSSPPRASLTPEDAYWRTPPEESFWRSAASPPCTPPPLTAPLAPPSIQLPPPALPLPSLPTTTSAATKRPFESGAMSMRFTTHDQTDNDQIAEQSPAQLCEATTWLLREIQDHWSASTPSSAASSESLSSSSAQGGSALKHADEEEEVEVEVAPQELLYDASLRVSPSSASISELQNSTFAAEEEEEEQSGAESDEDEQEAAEEKERSRDVGWYAAAWTLRHDDGGFGQTTSAAAAVGAEVELYA